MRGNVQRETREMRRWEMVNKGSEVKLYKDCIWRCIQSTEYRVVSSGQ